jgi:hypothetical protein
MNNRIFLYFLSRRSIEMKSLPKLAKAQVRDNGAIAFRLLSVSLQSVEIEFLKIAVTDVIFAFVTGEDGIPSEMPMVTLQIESKDSPKEKIVQQLSNQQKIQRERWELKLDYVLEGEFPDLPKQSAVHMTCLFKTH